MQTRLFLYIALFLSFNGHAQNYIGLQWNDTDIGHNMGIFYEHDFNTFNIGVGVTALLDNPRLPTGHAYRKRAHARKPIDKIGLNLIASKPIYHYQDIQLSVALRSFYANTYFRRNDRSPKINSFEQYVGFKLDIALSERLILKQSAGGGLANFFDRRFQQSHFDQWELSYFATIGLAYKFDFK